MQKEILNQKQLEILEQIKKAGGLNFQLAGGTALALILGHRKSIDFDFFSEVVFETKDLLKKVREITSEIKPIQQQKDTLTIDWQGVFVSFFYYNYPQLAKGQESPWGFTISSLEDIAVMKLEAIAGRGSRKDFIDLYYLCQKVFNLKQVFELFSKKFKDHNFDAYHRLRALTFYEEADAEPMPEMLIKTEWSQVKIFFQSQVKKYWGETLT